MIMGGASRTEAARAQGMDIQILRYWVLAPAKKRAYSAIFAGCRLLDVELVPEVATR